MPWELALKNCCNRDFPHFLQAHAAEKVTPITEARAYSLSTPMWDEIPGTTARGRLVIYVIYWGRVT